MGHRGVQLAIVYAAVASAALDVTGYMVRMCPGSSQEEVEAVIRSLDLRDAPRTAAGAVFFSLARANRGFHAGGLSRQEAAALALTPSVCRVERDALVRASAYNWGVDRILNTKGLDGSYDTPLTPFSGVGVDVYVLDSGLDTTHMEFDASDGSDGFFARTVTNVYDAWGGALSANNDAYGHGTHVAAIVGGRTVGVAAGANILGVRILNDEGAGSISKIVAAIEWVIDRREALGAAAPPYVINMSLESADACDNDCPDKSLYLAVADAVEAGIVVVVAAGNSDDSACDFVPSAAGAIEGCICVGGFETDQDFWGDWQDVRDVDSNKGICLDLWAPGLDVRSADASTVNGYTKMSGTSQAAPFAAGVAAQHLEATPARRPSEIECAGRAPPPQVSQVDFLRREKKREMKENTLSRSFFSLSNVALRAQVDHPRRRQERQGRRRAVLVAKQAPAVLREHLPDLGAEPVALARLTVPHEHLPVAVADRRGRVLRRVLLRLRHRLKSLHLVQLRTRRQRRRRLVLRLRVLLVQRRHLLHLLQPGSRQVLHDADDAVHDGFVWVL